MNTQNPLEVSWLRSWRLWLLEPPDRKPNIVFILADDLGWATRACTAASSTRRPISIAWPLAA